MLATAIASANIRSSSAFRVIDSVTTLLQLSSAVTVGTSPAIAKRRSYWPGRWVRFTPLTLHVTGPFTPREPSNFQTALAAGFTPLTAFTPSDT